MTDTEKEIAWKQYNETKDIEIRNKLILEYAPLVKIVAGRLSMYLGSNVEYEELVSFGTLGLIDAIDKFNTKVKAKFETYASLRIKGSIIDQLRKYDWIPRAVRDKQKVYNKVEEDLYNRLGRQPSDREIIEALGIDEDEYYSNQLKLIGTNIVSIDDDTQNGIRDDSYSLSDTLKQSTYDSPEHSVIREELKEKLAAALQLLTENERKVIELYYYSELTLREIGKVMSITESRVSQLHSKALNKMKVTLGEYIELFYNFV